MPTDNPRFNLFEDSNKNSIRNQQDIIENPEETQDDPYGTMSQAEAIKFPGDEVPRIVTESVTAPDENGRHTHTKVIHLMHDQAGRIIRADEIVGFSWTGKKIPQGSLYSCANPWFDHPEIRNVYLGIDGHVAIATGYVLCKPCFLKNKKKHDLKKLLAWTLLRWFYHPDLY